MSTTRRASLAGRDLIRKPRIWLLVGVALVMGAIGAARQGTAPTEKAFDAVGGEEALIALEGFLYEAEGDSYEPEQGLQPKHIVRSSTFKLELGYSVEGDRLSLAWQREILAPLQGQVAYRDVVVGGVGYQTGRGNAFLPPDGRSDGALSPMRVGAIRHEVRLLNPLLILRALAMDAELATANGEATYEGRKHHIVEITNGPVPVQLYVDEGTGRLFKAQTLQNDHVWGDVVTEVVYDDWTATEGGTLLFPSRVDVVVNGTTLRSERRTGLQLDPRFAGSTFFVSQEGRGKPNPAAIERGAVNWLYIARWHALGLPFGDRDETSVNSEVVLDDPDIRHLTGAFHHSLAIRTDDGVVVVDSPLNEARSNALLAEVEEIWPGTPVTHLILTHHHYDHMGGFRTFAAAGVTIITSELNRAYLERALASTHTLVPDALAAVPSATWMLESVPVDGRMVLDDREHSIEVRHVQTRHSSDMLVVHLPESRVVFASDLYHAGLLPPEIPMPAPFDALARNLEDGLDALGWDVDWIVGGHGASPGLGGVRPISDLHAHAEGAR